MEYHVKSGNPEKQRTACIVMGVFEPRRPSSIAEHLDEVSGGYVSNILRRGDLEGKLGQILLLHNVPGTLADRVLLIGCGKERDLGDKEYQQIIEQSITTLNDTGSLDAVSFLTDLNVKGRDISWKVRYAVECTEATLYTFEQLKSKKSNARRPLKRITFSVPTRRDLHPGEEAVTQGKAISLGMSFTKNLANLPGNICTPTYVCEQVQQLVKEHATLTADILDNDAIVELKMGALLAVAQGSQYPAQLAVIKHMGKRSDSKPIVLVGKGITFDSGGLSLKPANSMVGMKYDMCGAATVLGTIKTAATLNLPINIIGVLALAENMPSGTATRPDDVVTSLSGKTIEINNTDAEGRLVLCDALTFCERFKPDVVIDIATLTGACIIALGSHAHGLFSNHSPLAHDLLNAGVATGDRAWQLPIWEDYQEQLESSVADFCNTGGREAGSITAACFLARFTKKFHWAHLDVAGTASVRTGPTAHATGRPVPLLVQYLLDRAYHDQGHKGK